MAAPTQSPAAIAVSDPHDVHAGAHGAGGDGHGHGDLMLVGHDGQLHPAHLQHHFVSAEQQFEASKLGMWLFLATEILMFGGMFVAYGIFRVMYPELFAEASTQLDTILGATNTLFLLLSSFTMAYAIRGAQIDNQKVLFWNLIATIVLASLFMVVKYFEYTHKFELGIFPGVNFELEEGVRTVGELARGEVEAAPLATEPNEAGGLGEGAPLGGGGGQATVGEAASAGVVAEHGGEHDAGHEREGEIFSNRRAGIFFSIYYVMTGLHGLHVLIGIGVIGFLAYRSRQGAFSSVYYTPVENVGLYWHVVDIIWIFLFPLMYLI